jgi:hypothetical protein
MLPVGGDEGLWLSPVSLCQGQLVAVPNFSLQRSEEDMPLVFHWDGSHHWASVPAKALMASRKSFM